MGWFGGFISKCVSTVKEVGHKVVEKTKEIIHKAKEGVTNVWNKFTGKKTFEEAERLYEELTERYNTKRRQFDEELKNLIDAIEKHVEVINKSKEKIKTELFVQMANSMEKIKDINVNKDFSLEEYKAAIFTFDTVRTKQELYKIDFNKHKFKTTVQAIFTLGFYTRKKAKETLYAVEEEGYKIDTEIAKMEAELVKLRVIEESLNNVETYFTSLIVIYEQLLVRLDNSVHYLYIRCISFAHKLLNQEMSIKKLPVMQQKEVNAIITASKILKVMTEAQIVSLEEEDKVQNYCQDLKTQHDSIGDIYSAA